MFMGNYIYTNSLNKRFIISYYSKIIQCPKPLLTLIHPSLILYNFWKNDLSYQNNKWLTWNHCKTFDKRKKKWKISKEDKAFCCCLAIIHPRIFDFLIKFKINFEFNSVYSEEHIHFLCLYYAIFFFSCSKSVCDFMTNNVTLIDKYDLLKHFVEH